MDVREQIDGLVAERYRLQRCKKSDEEIIKKLDEQIIDLMLGEGEEKMKFDDYSATVVPSHNSHIDRAALILAGVAGETVDACTKKTPYTYVNVRKRKAKGEGSEEGEGE